MHTYAQRPGETHISLLSFSLEEMVMLSKQTASSFLLLLQEQMGIWAMCSSLQACFLICPGNTSSQSWGQDGGPEGAAWPCSPFPAEKQAWPHWGSHGPGGEQEARVTPCQEPP